MSSMSQRSRNNKLEKLLKTESQLSKHRAEVLHKHRELNSLEQMLAHPQAEKPSIYTRLKDIGSRIIGRKPENKQMFDSLDTGTSDIRRLRLVNDSEQQQNVAARHRNALRLLERVKLKIPKKTQTKFNLQADKLDKELEGMDHLGQGNENEEALNEMLEELKMTRPTIHIPTIPTIPIPIPRPTNPTRPTTIPRPTNPTRPTTIPRPLPEPLPDDLFKDDKIYGGRRNPKKKPIAKKPKKKPTKLNRGADMNMKDIRGLCKVNQIKLSKTKDGVRVIYTKKELITKLKRKKIL